MYVPLVIALIVIHYMANDLPVCPQAMRSPAGGGLTAAELPAGAGTLATTSVISADQNKLLMRLKMSLIKQ